MVCRNNFFIYASYSFYIQMRIKIQMRVNGLSPLLAMDAIQFFSTIGEINTSNKVEVRLQPKILQPTKVISLNCRIIRECSKIPCLDLAILM